MSNFKLVSMVAPALILLSTQAVAAPILTGDLAKLTVFADTYMTTGANTQILGNVTSGDVETTGAGSRVVGNVISGGAANVGASIVGGSQTTISVGGFISSGGLVTTGDGSIVKGDITSSGAANIGANAQARSNVTSGDVGTAAANAVISGNFTSVGAGTIGANARVGGTMATGGLATVGANAFVGADVNAGGNTAISASATVNGTVSSSMTTAVSPSLTSTLTQSILDYVASVASQVRATQTALTNYVMSGISSPTVLAATMTVDTTLNAGMYSAASLSTTAGTTLSLDADHKDNQIWIFNIADILSFGGTSKVKIINGGANEQVFWNVGAGQAKSGDGAEIVGTILAKDFVMIGANSTVAPTDGTCGGVFSQTSYVSTGANAIIGGKGCNEPAAPTPTNVPEPATFSLMLAGLALIGYRARSKK